MILSVSASYLPAWKLLEHVCYKKDPSIDCLMHLTRRGHHLLPFLKQSSFQTVSWIEGISFMSRH